MATMAAWAGAEPPNSAAGQGHHHHEGEQQQENADKVPQPLPAVFYVP